MTSATGRHSLECCCESVSFDGEGPLEDYTSPLGRVLRRPLRLNGGADDDTVSAWHAGLRGNVKH